MEIGHKKEIRKIAEQAIGGLDLGHLEVSQNTSAEDYIKMGFRLGYTEALKNNLVKNRMN